MTDAPVSARPPSGRGARERIERAAAQLFYRNGIHATGVELIAQQANVSKRTLYQHFPSKNDLVDDYLRGIDARGVAPGSVSATLPCPPASDCSASSKGPAQKSCVAALSTMRPSNPPDP